jgi:Holliday junction resolvasome RuvABC endonuclease subunit
MTSPAVCIHKGTDWSFDNCKIHYLTKTKKFEGEFQNVTGHTYPEFNTSEQRFNNISEWVFDLLTIAGGNVIGLNAPMSVTIEGYSMGSKGQVFHIAENTGLLKHKLWNHKIPFDTPAPTTIKKFATGKGNAKKERMYECFLAETGVDISALLDCKPDNNPCSDVVDAYWMCKYSFENNPN